MIFTTKAEYGVRLLVELGRQGSGPAGVPEGDRRGREPAARLPRADRGAAQEAGLVESTRGAHGGYVLARPAEEITMDEVVLALEGAIAPMDCFLDDRDGARAVLARGDDGDGCATKLLWTRVQMGVVTLAAAHDAGGARRVRLAAPARRRLSAITVTTRLRRPHGRARDQEPARHRRRQADPQGGRPARPRRARSTR